MKVCPSCRTTFDDSQNFCLNDGTPLVSAESEPPTVAAPLPPQRASQINYQAIPPAISSPRSQPHNAPAPKSRTGLIIALTALATVLLVAAGAGAWLFFARRDNRAAQINTNANSTARPTPARNANVSNANSAANSPVAVSNKPPDNVNLTNNNNPAPQPTVSAATVAVARQEASNLLNSWVNSLESGNLDRHLGFYADTVDYYQGRYSRNQISADKQRAFEQYDSLQMNVSNVRTDVAPPGNSAVVTYDKEWRFEGADKSSEGKVQSQLTLEKINNRWLITGERDLRVYYQR